MRYLLILFALSLTIQLSAQENFNLELVGQIDTPDSANDVWGFVGNNGKEYAIVGTKQSTKIIDISTPSNPIMIDSIPGTFTIWRDVKSYGDYIYITTDGNNVSDGLLVIDASDIENKIEYQYLKIPIEVMDGQFTVIDTIFHCHNIFIDEKGYGYLAGCDVGNRGVIILDLFTDPLNPAVVGIEDEAYSHDVYVRDDLMYSSELYTGSFAIYDIVDRAKPVYLSGARTSFEFTHNAWLSDDGDYLFTTDERPHAFVDAFDISDFNNIKKIDSFQPPGAADKDIIPHNTHFINDYLVTSWYSKGVVITDVSRPDNMIQVGAYDTFVDSLDNGNGCWGAYPYLPSGLILATDRTNGLFVFQPKYERASFLEGTVTVKNTGSPINEVQIEIESNQENNRKSNVLGAYKTGLAQAGTYDVTFSHKNYQTFLVENVELRTGEVTTLNVELESLSTATKELQVETSVYPNPFNDAVLVSWSSDSIKQLELYNMEGKLTNTFIVDGLESLLIDDVQIEEGTYLLRFVDELGLSKSITLIKK